jgi:hypothetical protein
MATAQTSFPRQEQLALVWESDIVQHPNGSVTLTARVPLSHMSRKQAAKAIGCSERVVSQLYRLGILVGYKPGGWRKRADGKGSNAKVRLDSGSVLAYKAAQVRAAKEWQAAQDA